MQLNITTTTDNFRKGPSTAINLGAKNVSTVGNNRV